MLRFLLSVALVLVLVSRASAQCLPDTVQCMNFGFGDPTASTAPGQSCIGSWDATHPCFGACYDLVRGQLAILTGGTLAPWSNYASSADTYQLLGPDAGTPVAIRARMRVEGTLSAGSSGWASLQEGSSPAHRVEFAGGSVKDTLEVSLLVSSGNSFVIRGALAASGPANQTADVGSLLQFVGLAAGWSIVSCQGYDVPVPTRLVTWGRARAAYR